MAHPARTRHETLSTDKPYQTISNIRSLTSSVFGIAAGTLGLESYPGFAFYLLGSLLVSGLVWLLRADGAAGKQNGYFYRPNERALVGRHAERPELLRADLDARVRADKGLSWLRTAIAGQGGVARSGWRAGDFSRITAVRYKAARVGGECVEGRRLSSQNEARGREAGSWSDLSRPECLGCRAAGCQETVSSYQAHVPTCWSSSYGDTRRCRHLLELRGLIPSNLNC